jgi:hypothetical protein
VDPVALTVTRAGSVTVDEPNTNQQTPGLITEDAGTVSHVVFTGGNYVFQSDNMTSGYWAPSAAFAPAVDKLAETVAASAQHYTAQVNIPSTAGAPHTLTVKMKAAERSFAYAQIGTAYKQFDLSSCSVVAGSGLGTIGSFTVSVGGWCQVSVVATVAGSTAAIVIGISPSSGTYSYDGVAGSGIYVKEVQFNPGLTPNTYTATTTVPTGLIDTKSNVWTADGSVSQNPSTWNAPPSAGVFSDANYYSRAGTEQIGTLCIVFRGASSPAAYATLFDIDSTTTMNYRATATSVGYMRGSVGGTVAAAGGAPVPNSVNVVCGGHSGSTAYAKLNGGATGSGAVGTITTGTWSLGRYLGATFSYPDQILEVYATSTPWNEAAVSALQASVMAKINQPVLATCPADTLAVGPSGAEVWAQGVNLVGATASDFGNAVWAKGNATVSADTGVAVDGTVTADRITVTAGGAVAYAYQAFAGVFTDTRTTSFYIQAGTQGTAASVSSLTDGTSVGACTNITPTATPTRYSATRGPDTSVTNKGLAVFLNANCSAGTATAGDNILVSHAQHEVSAYPTPFTTATRNATVASIPLPDFSATDTACFGVTYTPGQDWNVNPATSKVLLGNYNAGSNAFTIDRLAGNLLFQVYDNAGANKIVTWAHGLGAVRTTKRIVGCMAAGTTALYVDGVSVGAVTGVGTALWSANQSPVYIGSTTAGGAFFLDGSISNVRIYPNATYRAGM